MQLVPQLLVTKGAPTSTFVSLVYLLLRVSTIPAITAPARRSNTSNTRKKIKVRDDGRLMIEGLNIR